MDRKIVVIAHNIRSAYNVGSLMRTCEGIGVINLYFSGYTPYPKTKKDKRLPHISRKLSEQIHKTALGAEVSLDWEYLEDVDTLLNTLSNDGFELVALEQTNSATKLTDYKPCNKVALLIGSEVEGIDPALLARIPVHLEIPMFGKKESFNVVEATSMALFHLRFTD